MKEFSDKKKKTLSSNEVNEFRKILDRKYDEGNTIKRPVYTDLPFLEIVEQMDRNRDILAHTLNFSDEEKFSLISLKDYFNDINIKYICYHFIFTVIDHKCIVEEKLTVGDAIDAKILFMLGITDIKDFRGHSRKTPLFDIIYLLKDYNYFAYNTVLNKISSKYAGDVNDKFSSLGSLLNPSAFDTKRIYNSSSMHVDVTLRRLRPPNKTSMFICDDYAETNEFKGIYDFYYKSKVKKVFESIIQEQRKNILKEKIAKSKEQVDKAKTTKIENLVNKYNSDLESKLKRLLNKNDTV